MFNLSEPLEEDRKNLVFLIILLIYDVITTFIQLLLFMLFLLNPCGISPVCAYSPKMDWQQYT